MCVVQWWRRIRAGTSAARLTGSAISLNTLNSAGEAAVATGTVLAAEAAEIPLMAASAGSGLGQAAAGSGLVTGVVVQSAQTGAVPLAAPGMARAASVGAGLVRTLSSGSIPTVIAVETVEGVVHKQSSNRHNQRLGPNFDVVA